MASALTTKRDIISEIVNKAKRQKLYEDPIWKVLLHYDNYNKRSFITDENFILSLKKGFSLEEELVLTIKSFIQPNNDGTLHPICRFPARLYWLTIKIPELRELLPEVECSELDFYVKKVSVDKLTLVFAAEDIKNPTSMMGHIFLKLEGLNDEDIYVEHAISFFAVIDTVNPLSLLVKSTITGMDSFFLLKPYRKFINKYLIDENRVIWEFPITNISDEVKELIRYHIWELKHVKTKYYFTSYNCSTVIYYILSLANPSLLENRPLWVSPRDVIRHAKKQLLIKEAILLPTNEWLIRILEENISVGDIYKVKKNIHQRRCPSVNFTYKDSQYKLYFFELYNSYALYMYKNRAINKDEVKYLLSCSPRMEKYTFTLVNYKDPYNAPLDTRISIGYYKFYNRDYIYLTILPIYNTLLDNNKSFLAETDLRLFEMSVLFNKSSLRLKHLYIYHAYYLKPYSILVGGSSYNFKIGIEHHYYNLKPILSMFSSGGIGITIRLSEDMYIFFLHNIGLGYGKDIMYPYTFPEVGFIVYEIFNMKSYLSYKYMLNHFNKQKGYNVASIKHTIMIRANLYIDLESKHIWMGNASINDFGLSIKFLY